MSPHEKETLSQRPRLEDDLVIITRYIVAHKVKRCKLGRMYDFGTTIPTPKDASDDERDRLEEQFGFPDQPKLGFKNKEDATKYKNKLTAYFKTIRETNIKKKIRSSITSI